MFKKLVAFVAAAMLALSLVGCGADPSMPTPAAAELTVSGTVTDAAMNTTTIKTADGKELTFATGEAQVTMKDGLLLGDVVAITYKGDIKDGDTTGVTVVSMKDGADNSKNPLRLSAAAQSESSETSASVDVEATIVTGEVTAVGMSAITIKTEDGTELSFLSEGAEKTVTEKLVEGVRVSIAYTGEISGTDTSAATVLRITDPVA